ncbi:MAG: SHD1 domain-containing protein [Pirellula sp.]
MMRPLIQCIPIVILLSHFVCQVCSAQEKSLEYSWSKDQKFSFEIEIEADEGDQTTNYQGTTNYTVDSANAEQLALKYQGGLTALTKPKESARKPILGIPPFGIPPFGPAGLPRGIPFPGLASPYATNGISQTTNRITMSRLGKLLVLDGSSQLPFLLGNLSLLPFENLPSEKADEAWTIESNVSISEDDSGRFHFGPFAQIQKSNQGSVQSASEETKYTINNSNDMQVTFDKTYRLKTALVDGRDSFEMSGKGTWIFNRIDKLPQSSDMKFELIVRRRNATVSIPIVLKFNRLTPERIAERELEAKRKAKEAEANMAEAKAKMEEHRKLAEEAKAKAEAPLTTEEKKGLLTELNAESSNTVIQALMKLSTKKSKETDSEIVNAIKKHIGSSNSVAASLSERALENWDPVFGKANALKKAYEGSSPVDSTNLEVLSTTPLYVGQIVQIQENGSFWFAAEIRELLPDGRVLVKYQGWGGNRTATLARRNIQLAPADLPQPHKPATPNVPQHETRVWSDATGGFKVDAVFMGIDNDKVKLKRADGKEVSVPIARLSSIDQAYIKKIADAIKNLDNPFDPK